MRRYLVLYLLALCFLTACAANQEAEETTVVHSSEETIVQTEETVPEIMTEAELLNLFYANAGSANRTVVDCAVVTDSAYDLIGVILYTVTDEEGCSFDFLKKDGNLGGRIGIGSSPAEDTALEYLANGAFSCQLLRTDGTSYLCEIFYTNDGNGGINFEVTG